MAREYAPLLLSIGQDDDFCELGPIAQWLYLRLTARTETSYAGVAPVNLRKWARMSRHVTVSEVEKAYLELRDARFLIADDDEEYDDEVLVRSLMRSGEMYKQPNVMRGACKAAMAAESPAVRRALAEELRRMLPDTHERAADAVREAIAALDPNEPSPTPPEEPSAKGSAKGSPEPSPNPDPGPPGGDRETPVGEGMPEPFAVPPGTDTGTGTAVPSPDTPVESDPSPTSGGSGGKATRKRSAGGADPRGHRLPDDWQPSAEDIAWFRENCPDLEGRGRELTDEFRDYWLARAGREARKVDWSKTWRNRMRDRQDRARNRRQAVSGSSSSASGSSRASPTTERVAHMDDLAARYREREAADAAAAAEQHSLDEMDGGAVRQLPAGGTR